MEEGGTKTLKDLTGQRFGRLTVVGLSDEKRDSHKMWECECDCGNRKNVLANPLVSGKTKSCGCLYKETVGKASRTHGASNTRLYKVWRNMVARCHAPYSTDFHDYGERGIKVCEEWKSDFLTFAKWATENGYDPLAKRNECTVDRIDTNGDYEPSNCRITNQKKQCNNKRNNRIVSMTVSELADITGLDYFALYNGIVRKNGNVKDIVNKLRETAAEVNQQ